MKITNKSFRIDENGEIQLCTGVKDCCGKLIYEGDILTDTRPSGCFKIKIIYKNGDFFYDCISAKKAFAPFKYIKTTGLFPINKISKILKIVEPV